MQAKIAKRELERISMLLRTGEAAVKFVGSDGSVQVGSKVENALALKGRVRRARERTGESIVTQAMTALRTL